MTVTELLADVTRRGIEVVAQGDRLWCRPRSAVTPELVERLRTHKAELLAILGHAGGPGARNPGQPELGTGQVPCRRCGSPGYIDVPIHNGQSVRRDCARCGRFIAFVVWYGRLMHPGAN